MVIQRLYDRHWWIVGSTKPVRRKDQSSWVWVVRNFTFPEPDLGMGYEIGAVFMNNNEDELPIGFIDYYTLKRHAKAVSRLISINISKDIPEHEIAGSCYIDILSVQDINGNPISVSAERNEPIEVNYVSLIKGQVYKPKDTVKYLVVHSIRDHQRWVMLDKGDRDTRGGEGKEWSDTAYFGRPEMDVGDLFHLQGIVFKDTILNYFTQYENKFLDRKFTDSEWHDLEKNLIICYESKEVIVRRRVSPSDLVITQIGDRYVSHGTEENNKESRVVKLEQFDSPIKGGIESSDQTYALRGESIWILRKKDSDEKWEIAGWGRPYPDKLSWRVPDFRFSASGQYMIKAIATKNLKLEKGKPIPDDIWISSSITRESPTISVKVTPEVENVIIPSYDKPNANPH